MCRVLLALRLADLLTLLAMSSFIEEPSVVRLEALRVEDLHAVADHYGLTVPKLARKAKLLASVRDGLVEKGVLFICEKEEEAQEDSQAVSFLRTGRLLQAALVLLLLL